MTKDELKEQIKTNEERIEILIEERKTITKYYKTEKERDELKKLSLVGLATFTVSSISALVASIMLFTGTWLVYSILLGVSIAGMIAGSTTSLMCDVKSRNINPLACVRVEEIDMEIAKLRDENMSLQEQINNLANNKTESLPKIPSQKTNELVVNVELKAIQEEKNKYTKNPLRSGKR